MHFLERTTFYKTIISSPPLVACNTIHHVCGSAPLTFSHSVPKMTSRTLQLHIFNRIRYLSLGILCSLQHWARRINNFYYLNVTLTFDAKLHRIFLEELVFLHSHSCGFRLAALILESRGGFRPLANYNRKPRGVRTKRVLFPVSCALASTTDRICAIVLRRGID